MSLPMAVDSSHSGMLDKTQEDSHRVAAHSSSVNNFSNLLDESSMHNPELKQRELGLSESEHASGK